MKRIITTILGMSILAVSYAQDIRSLEIGSQLPGKDIIMKDVAGKEINLEQAKTEKGLLVMFSCNTCPYVIKSQQRTKEIIAIVKDQNIGMVILNSNEGQREDQDSYEAMKKYAKEQGYSVPYVLDKGAQMADLFGATRTPEVFLFDQDGNLVYHGAMEDNPSSPKESKELYLQNAIEKMSSGELPEPSFTKSIGCTIKRKG